MGLLMPALPHDNSPHPEQIAVQRQSVKERISGICPLRRVLRHFRMNGVDQLLQRRRHRFNRQVIAMKALPRRMFPWGFAQAWMRIYRVANAVPEGVAVDITFRRYDFRRRDIVVVERLVAQRTGTARRCVQNRVAGIHIGRRWKPLPI